MLVPFITAETSEAFHAFIKHKNGTCPWFELSNAKWRLEGEELPVWHPPGSGWETGAVHVEALPAFPRSKGAVPPNMRVGFLANELLDPAACSAAQLSHCLHSFCNASWPLSYNVHHCMNTWRGRIGTT